MPPNPNRHCLFSDTNPQSKPAQSKRWATGTLVYTSGGIVLLFCWLLFGDFAWAMRDRSVNPMAQWHLKSISAPNLIFGLLISSFPSFLTLVLAPIISVKSDRHRDKCGRRVPFLMVTTPLTPIVGLLIDATGGNYRWAFACGAVLALIAPCMGVVVYRQFIKYGGHEGYTAP